MKVGDQVAVEYKYLWSNKRKYEIRTIAKLTSSFIVLDDAQRFYKGTLAKHGMPIGAEHRLVTVTSHIALEVARESGIEFLRQMDWDLLHSEKILDIMKIINEELRP